MPDNAALRRLPSVDRLLASPAVSGLTAELGHAALVVVARDVLADARRQAIEGGAPSEPDSLERELRRRALALIEPGPHSVINATGVIVHTNLGRAPLSAAAADAMRRAAAGYSDLEFDLANGSRGSRHQHVDELLCRVTGAEAGIVVNNNASAVLLVLATLAPDREVLVSRGQAVEIGGGFRIPDVLRQSGARLVEVGTTNRTYLADYDRAITPETGLLLRVHTSNFRIIGFVKDVPIEELATLGRQRGVAVVDDVGSGCLIDPRPFGLGAEPLVQQSVAAGASLVCFSADKLLGGPQAGIVVGRRDLVDRLERNPWARALRIDKASLAGLTATLLHYVKGEAIEQVPIWRMIATPAENVRARAAGWAEKIGGARVVPSRAAVGGGSLPEETMPSYSLCLSAGDKTEALARRLRTGQPAIVGRIERDCVLLDARTVLPDQDEALIDGVRRSLGA